MGRPSMGRPSMSTAGERKSSVGVRRSNSYGSGGGKSDTRPLMDKAHLNASLHKLMDYLLTHGYDQPLNKKKLLSPSGRDFNNITGFLFRQLDPNYMVSQPVFLIQDVSTEAAYLKHGSSRKRQRQRFSVFHRMCVHV